MFGDLMSNFQNQQEELQKQLKTLKVEISYQGIAILGNAAREIHNITVADELLTDKEMLEDILLETMNRFIYEVSKAEADAAQNAMQDMLPPGFSDLLG